MVRILPGGWITRFYSGGVKDRFSRGPKCKAEDVRAVLTASTKLL